MKRYLFILIAAVVAFTSCELIITETNPDVVWHFSSVEVETTENSATVNAVKPYITIDGVKEEGVDIYLKLWEDGNEEGHIIINDFEDLGDLVIFTINDLAPATHYLGGIVVSGEYGGEISSIFPITTKAHMPVAEYSCECIIEPMGVVAYALLDGVSFTLDGMESPLAKVEFKYALSSSAEEWTTVEIKPEDAEKSFKIPAEGEPYLKEKSDYNYSVTLYPEDAAYESYTIDGKFTTTEASLTSNVELPTITATEEAIHLSSKVPTLFVDGEVIPDYATIVYKFYYTNYNGHEGFIDAVCADGVMSAMAELSMFQEGVTYNFRTCMEVNDMILLLSGDAPYTIPVVETPTPPAPPVSGDADTKALAGEWHLTEWRGAVPSFDVYLSISEDGVVTLWQRMESRLWETFYSTVGFDGSIIAGEYTDGVAWATSYYVAVDGDTMTWTNTADSGEVSVYTRCTLPDFTNPDIRTYATMGTRWF
ncbi:MAG: hypothetical protein IKV77_10790 [Alistipes sp.]|nr:hypothetical protein [Alistipes sp.]MBR5769971.1 hypothetical protein [Alistipes sp.]